MSTINSSFWLAVDDKNQPLGVSWGFIEHLPDLTNRLELPPSNFPTCISNSKIGYQAAIAVKEVGRNKGIASKLFQKRESDMRQKKSEYLVVRTIVDSVMYQWLNRKEYKVFFYYPQEVRYQRVLMYKPI